VGYAFVEYEGEIAPTVVVFAEEGDESVLGLHALESLGLEVDPVTRQVRRSEALIAL
jgi:predicted aspartyl protease